MSSFAGYCGVCDKPVMHKTFFGTLHLCLSAEERVAQAIQAQKQQRGNAFMHELRRKYPDIAKAVKHD